MADVAGADDGMPIYYQIGIVLILACIGIVAALFYNVGGITKTCAESKTYPFAAIKEWCKKKVNGDSKDTSGSKKSPIELLELTATEKYKTVINKALAAGKAGVREVYMQKKVDASKGVDCTPYYKQMFSKSGGGGRGAFGGEVKASTEPNLDTENQFRCAMIKKKIESASGSGDDKEVVGKVAFDIFAYLNREAV
tara:strand:+ start:76 stop:663 length:588 start_codon:yes stop_codon:yes gene_type:complete